MKKFDYYAVNQPWKMPKWLGFTLGGIFGVIAIGSALAIHDLTKSNAPAAVIAAVTPAAKPVVAATEPTVVAPEPAAAAPAAEKVATRSSSRHHAIAKKHAKASHVAVAKRGGLSDSKAHAILAKRDAKSNRHDKDALDKLLGL